ncbi:MAG: hypothetical protein V3R83_08395 [Gammaproteobacteria bacterium]
MRRSALIFLGYILLSVSTLADEPFVPEDFVVPDVLETERIRLRMLTVFSLERETA